MERALLLIEATGERVSCLLNPEHVDMRRLAGVRPRRVSGGKLSGQLANEDPLLFTGGGRTEIDLDLLFDVDIEGSTIDTRDVRELTSRLWRLTEGDGRVETPPEPPRLLFVWGKAWNVPAVAIALSERLERFGAGGVPGRSWLRLRLLRIPPHLDEARSGASPEQRRAARATDGGGVARPDLEAFHATGDPGRWREFAREAADSITGSGG